MKQKYTFIPKKQDCPVIFEIEIKPVGERRIADSVCEICHVPSEYAVTKQMCPGCDEQKSQMGLYKQEAHDLIKRYGNLEWRYEASIFINIVLLIVSVILLYKQC